MRKSNYLVLIILAFIVFIPKMYSMIPEYSFSEDLVVEDIDDFTEIDYDYVSYEPIVNKSIIPKESYDVEYQVYGITVEDFESIHADISEYTRNNGITYINSDMYAQGSRIIFNVVSENWTHHSINKFKYFIEDTFKKYGYSVEAVVLVLNPTNYDLVVYSV